MNNKNANETSQFDHGTHQEFADYYEKESFSDSSKNRMEGIYRCVSRYIKSRGIRSALNVADIGCGAGTMSMMWAKDGHFVHGLDVNKALLDIATERAKIAGMDIDYKLGSATQLPWANESMDVCIAPELLEHVAEWELCLSEFVRVLKTDGILYISTSNKLCPKQEEFNLPFYSWYPSALKHYYENLARTTRPDIAGYATYPAINWFTYYQLKHVLGNLGMEAFDRFDIMEQEGKSVVAKSVIRLLKNYPIVRWFGHVATPWLIILAIKK